MIKDNPDVSDLYHIALCIHGMLKDGEPVESEYIEQLGDALEGVNMITGWGDEVCVALAKIDEAFAPSDSGSDPKGENAEGG